MQRIRCTDAAEGSYRLEFSDHRSADGEAWQTLKKKQSNEFCDIYHDDEQNMYYTKTSFHEVSVRHWVSTYTALCTIKCSGIYSLFIDLCCILFQVPFSGTMIYQILQTAER